MIEIVSHQRFEKKKEIELDEGYGIYLMKMIRWKCGISQ